MLNAASSSWRGYTRWLWYLAWATAAALVIRIALFDLWDRGSPFHGHGYCYLWQPTLVATHAVSDLAIGLAYVAISATLFTLVRRTRDRLPYPKMFLAFGTFIVACGFTHFMEVWTLWTPVFWLSADVKLITAVASVATAVLLPPLVPKVLALVDAADISESRRVALEQAHDRLEASVQERTQQLKEALERERHLRTAAERAVEIQEQFLRVASHELRTPLNAISGWATMLLEGQDPPYARGLQVIARNAEAQTRLVDDLLAVSSLDLGKLRVDPVPLNLRQITEGAIDVVRFAATNKRQAIALTVSSALPDAYCVLGDGPRLQQVVSNLLSNAVKFTPEAGRIDLHLSCTETHVRLTVRDTGPGIEPAFLPNVFDRFAQSDSSTTRVHGGLGIGLTIAKRLVELHGCRISASSVGVGHGAEFVVTLPRYSHGC